jgi:hypothetical protein
MQNEPFHANQSMKTHIMFRRALTALAFAAALALPSAPGRAQTNAGPQPRSEPMMTQPEGPPVAGLPHPTFTLRENTNTVRQKFPPPAPPTPAPTAPVGPPSATPVQYDLEIENSMLLMSGPNNPVQKAPATLPNIVKLLTEEHSDVNIAMAPELKDVQVEDLKLHATQVG